MVAITGADRIVIRVTGQGVPGTPGSGPPEAHAPTHSDGGTDEITVEDLATGGAVGSVPTSDGAGALVMTVPAGGGDVTSPGGETAGNIPQYTGDKAIAETSLTFTAVSAHLSDTTNPHSVTAAQVAADPVGTAAAAVSAHNALTSAHSALPVENLTTAGALGEVAVSDGAGNLTMQAQSGAGGATLGSAWKLDVSTVMADPGSKDFRINNADQTLGSQLALSSISDSGQDVSVATTKLDINDVIYIQENNDATHSVLYVVSGPAVDNGTWVQVPVAFDSGQTQIATNKKCGFLLFFSGSPAAHGDLTGLTTGDDHTQYQLRSEQDANGGYAGLDGASKLTGSQQVYGSASDTAVEGNDSRVPIQGENDALVGTDGTPATGNPYVTNSDSRNTDARVPTGAAGGDLGGTYPNPTVDDGADSTAIHDNVPAEISVLTEKVTPVSGDHILIEDSADSNNKKRVQVGSLPTGGGGEANTISSVSDPGSVSPVASTPKVGIDLRLKEYLTDTSALSITTGPGEFLHWDLNAGSINHGDIADTGTNTHAQIDTHIAAVNPHSTTHASLSGGVGTDDHHSEAHTIVSHSDTTATGAELDELTDGSTTTLHVHAAVPDATAIHTDGVGEISTMTVKVNMVDGDLMVIGDSEDSDTNKSVTLAEVAAGMGFDRQLFNSNRSTGLLDGGVVTINGGDAALMDISDGNAIVVDSYTTPGSSVITLVAWTGLTGLTVDNLATSPISDIGINAAGSVVQQVNAFTIDEQHEIIKLAGLAHPSGIDILSISPLVNVAYDPMLEMVTFFTVFGPINRNGNLIQAAGTDLTVHKTSGSTWAHGANYGATLPQRKVPSLKPDPDLNPATFIRVLRDTGSPTGFTLIPGQTVLDPGFYDADGSGLPLEVVAANDWSIQHVYWLAGSEDLAVIYGQTTYNTKAVALLSLFDEVAVPESLLNEATLLARIVIKGNATDLSDTSHAEIRQAGKFGNQAGAAAGSQTLLGLADVDTTSYSGIAGQLLEVAPGELSAAFVVNPSAHNVSTDAHLNLSKIDGSIAYTGEVAGVPPTQPASFVIKSYADAISEFADDVFRVQGSGDPTKELAIEVDGITTGTVRTITVPDADITIDGTGDSRPPNGSATGDLSGSYPAPTVEGLSGRSISGTTPTEGQFLSLISSVWTPTSPGSGTDGDAVHVNVDAEISAITEETTPLDDDVFIMESAANSFSKRRVKAVNMPGSGGGGGFPVYKLPAVKLQGSLDSSSDWQLNVLAPLDADPDNDSIIVRSHNNTADEAWGYTLAIPSGAVSMTIEIRSRPLSAPAGAVTLIPLIYFREEPNGAAVGSWFQGLSASAMDTINFPITDIFYTYHSQTETLVDWGITADTDWKFQIFNDESASSLASFWLVRYVEVTFS